MSTAEQLLAVDEEFLIRLYAGVPDDIDAYAAIVGPSTGYAAGEWIHVNNVMALANAARNERTNAYINVHPAVGGITSGRSKSTTTAAVVGWVADLDFDVPGHATKNLRLPADWNEARTILDAAGVPEPTMIVMSGGGAQCYWLAERAWLITDDDSRDEIAAQSKRFASHLKATGAAMGMHVDSVGDLARILRVPGTIREKDGCDPVTVQLLTSYGPSYGWDELAAWAPPEPVRQPRQQRTHEEIPEHLEQGVRLIVESYQQKISDIETMTADSGRHNAVRDAACWIGSHLHYLREAKIADPAQDLYDAAVCCDLVSHEGHKTVAKTIDSGIEIGEAAPYFLPPLKFKKGVTAREKTRWTPGAQQATKARQTAQEAPQGDSGGPDDTDNAGGDDDGQERPEVVTNNRELGEIRDETLEAIHKANEADPALFLRSGVIVTVTSDENGRALIVPTTKPALRNYATDAAVFKTQNIRHRDGESYIVETLVSPPTDVVEAILALPPGKLPFSSLVALTEAPIIRPDGSIRTEPGYDPATRLYYLPGEPVDMPEIPERPTGKQLAAARETLEDLVADFPFVDQASRANAIGMIVGSVIRSAVDGPAPLAVVDATSPGTGKSLLTDMVAVISTGRPAAFIAWPNDEEEARKMMTSAFAGGSTLLPIDNVEGGLRSRVLTQAITARSWSDRMLGQTNKLELPVRCSWIVNGNGVTLKGDLPRRVYWIRMEAQQARPWTRSGFRHPNLIEHVRKNRGEILAAILTMARGWYAAGTPKSKTKEIGTFEDWTRKVAGILETAGIEGFLANAEQLYEANNVDAEEWIGFLTAIRQAEFPKGEFTAGDVAEKLLSAPITWRDVIPSEIAPRVGKSSTELSKAIGEAFGNRAGRRWDEEGMRLVRAQKVLADGSIVDKKNRLKSAIWTIAFDVTADDL
ncbi:MAG: hypothetical protein AB7G17_14630 [Phycisphaerales bacterium]